jgi:hypothetical protein
MKSCLGKLLWMLLIILLVVGAISLSLAEGH